MQNLEPIIYQAPNGAIELREDVNHETIWASLDQIAQVFGRDKSVISRHIKNIYNDNELIKDSTIAFFATVQKEWNREVSRNIEYFNLDMIISVWYRVNSLTWTKFRQRPTSLQLLRHLSQFTNEEIDPRGGGNFTS